MHWLESAAVLLITWIRLEPKIQVNTGEQRCWTSSRTEAAITDPNPSVHFLLTQHILICFAVLNVFYRPWLFWWFSRWKLSNMTKSFFFFLHPSQGRSPRSSLHQHGVRFAASHKIAEWHFTGGSTPHHHQTDREAERLGRWDLWAVTSFCCLTEDYRRILVISLLLRPFNGDCQFAVRCAEVLFVLISQSHVCLSNDFIRSSQCFICD